jgi:hypothetical protein
MRSYTGHLAVHIPAALPSKMLSIMLWCNC